MAKWNLIIDVAECHNCHNCVVAAKDEFAGNEFPGYTGPHPVQGPGVIRIERRVHGSGHQVEAAYLPRLCNHCDDAPCVKAGAGAVRKRDDGIVLFDPVACRGRRDLVDACPYGAVVWNEERQLPQTWFFDAHLLDGGWSEPRCVTVCPTRALQAVKVEDDAMAARARAEGLRALHPDLATKPRVYYRGLDRWDKCFIGGSVSASVSGQVDCIAGAEISLLQNEKEIAVTQSDDFGDFRFGGLAEGSGAYHVEIRHALGEARRACRLDASIYLGEIRLASLQA